MLFFSKRNSNSLPFQKYFVNLRSFLTISVKNMKKVYLPIVLLVMVGFVGCSAPSLTPIDFSWPVEVELAVDENGMVSSDRYSFSYSVKNLYFIEKGDSLGFADAKVRMIQGSTGHYYLTSEGFKNLYILKLGDSALEITKTVSLGENPITAPFFNNRNPFIELNYNSSTVIKLNKEGIVK